MAKGKLCLVGAGNMGGALLAGWISSGYPAKDITVIDPAPPPSMAVLIEDSGVVHVTEAADADRPDILVVAVKPQIMDPVLAGLVGLVDGDNVLVSVAAGITMEQLAAPFEAAAPRVVRAMPNTPSMVKRGMTVCVANDRVNGDQRTAVSDLMAAVGLVEWVEDEALMDAVTGVSGSGPAYVMHLVEALAAAGVAAGLSDDLALKLARQTVTGAGELIHQSDDGVGQLRKNVTSPNGTTAAALDVLMGADGLGPVMERAVAAATRRSQELAG